MLRATVKCKCIPARKKKIEITAERSLYYFTHRRRDESSYCLILYLYIYNRKNILIYLTKFTFRGLPLLYLNFTFYYYYTRSHYLFSIKSPHDQVITEKINYSIHICLTHIFLIKEKIIITLEFNQT